MYSIEIPFFLHALTSLHAGSGSEIGIVDLPIQREKHTGYPKIESSSLKGAIRSTVEAMVSRKAHDNKYTIKKDVELVFGKKTKKDNDESQASAISLADARTLLFPVKSMRGVFTFITCPAVLKRFNYELKLFTKEGYEHAYLPIPPARTISSEHLFIGKNQIVLEEYPYEMEVNNETMKLAEKLEKLLFPERLGFVNDRLVIVSDDDFSDFVQLSTEVQPRIRIDESTGVVEEKALFYEENLPPETILYSFLFIGNARVSNQNVESKNGENNKNNTLTAKEIEELFRDENYFPQVFQLGGDATIGRGLIRQTLLSKEGDKNND